MKTIIKIFCLIPIVVLFTTKSHAQILNAGFENWASGEPDNWHTNNVIGFPVGVTQSSDPHTGSSAILIETADFNGDPWIGAAISGSLILPFFDVSADYAEFTGYYKLHLTGPNGFGAVLVEFYDASWGGLVALGVGELATAGAYTPFTVVMDYTVGNGNPAASVKISLTFGAHQNTPSIGSWFLVDDLAFAGVAGIEEVGNGYSPEEFELGQNFPNPFNPSTNINFSVPEESFVNLKVYNVQGEEIATLVNENLSTGAYKVDWDASNLPSGVYVYNLIAGETFLSKKMLLMK